MAYKTIISAAELEHHLGQTGWAIVDCRHTLADPEWGSQAYLESHIPGAYFAHLDEDLSGAIIPGETGRHPLPSDWEAFAKLLGSWGIDASTQVVAYDASHGGIASRLWWILNYLGHEKVAVLDGGWENWVSEGRAQSTDLPGHKSAQFIAEPHPGMVRSMEDVLDAIHNKGVQVVDSRAAERYAGLEEPIDPVAGHIPGAVNFPFLENVNDDHQWKSRAFLRERFENLFQKHDPNNVIVHCGSGVTACHNLLAMRHAGYPMAKLYPGSWSEWVTRKENPVVSSK